MRKPSISDYKYLGLDFKDAEREYERDLMLWEQTEALKEANEIQRQQYEENQYDPVLEERMERERKNSEFYKELMDNTTKEINESIAKLKTPNKPKTDNTNNEEIQVKLAQQLNINYLLVKKLYKLINRYSSKSQFIKQLLLTWIEFRQTHYDYDYEAFLDEFEYDKVITNRYETTHFPITPKTNGTKEDYETMIKKMIKAILNDETYDPNDINNKNLFN